VGQGKEEGRLAGGSCAVCARHDFGTYVLQKTGNIAAVMNSMGHSDVKTAITYQPPELNVVRDAINSRHILRHTAETVKSDWKIWLPPRDSNPDMLIQSQLSCR
jgi:hypothetical protein